MEARHRHKLARIALAGLAALFLGPLSIMAGAAAATEMVKPLPGEDCKRVRLALENDLPFGPGFRRLEVAFPKNARGIEGHVCRLLTMGTGAHMEGYGIASLKDMRSKVRHALTTAGLEETPETARFSEESRHGREVFALYRDNAMCVTTIVVGMVDGATPAASAIKDGKLMLSRLKPHQREWWISVDCFTLPEPAKTAAKTGVKADVKAGGGADIETVVEPDVSAEAIKELEAEIAK